MDDKAKRILAKQIRNGLLTTHSECYRLKKIPKTMTIINVIKVIDAMTSESTEKWDEVFNTSLYKSNGSEYCSLLAYMHLKYKKELNIDY